MISNDAVIMGMLAVILGAIFITESSQNSALKDSIRSFRVFTLLLRSFIAKQFRYH
ncbi:hypothetical protein JCM19052_2499 [Vibrio sp. JCM 19052]|nr:hypothetical protein JCM19052_2499 [Vibrio sp. JCM 19052]